jgi:hypothetical protein
MVFLLFGFLSQIVGIFLGALVLNLEQKDNVDLQPKEIHDRNKTLE